MTKIIIILFTILAIAFCQTERWVYWYNGSYSYYDFANTIVYGADGNIYAAGRSYGGDTTGYDLVVVSVTSDNTQRWVYQYRGAGYGLDEAYSIAYGADGNIYLAGTTYDTTTVYDFTVISLTATGTERWVYKYNGPSNYEDWAYSLVYGADGNIYAVGKSCEQGYDFDFTIISLNTAGTELWVYHYNGPGDDDDWANSICYGADGNLYAAGRSNDSITRENFTLISVTNSGSERWVYSYNGPGNDVDNTHSLVYGADGNVYAAGYSTGNETGPDFTVLSVASNGDERWVYRYHEYGRTWDDANALVYGTDGNIYAAGYSFGQSGTSEDIVVSSLNTTGNERWVYRYNGPRTGYDEAFCLTYGADGNIYTGGTSSHTQESQLDLIVISLNPSSGIEEEFTTSRYPQTAFRISLGTFQNQNLNYALSLPEPATVTLSLYNLSGQKIFSWQINANQGISHYVKNLPNLSIGVYIIRAEVLGKGYKENKKFIVVK
jgi:uncharacterized delta-60 repeat protein